MSKPGTRVEFYRKGEPKHLAVVSGVGAVPREGDLVNIRQVTWKVHAVTWCVDQADNWAETELRCNVDLVAHPLAAQDRKER